MTASHIQFQAAWLHTNSVNVNLSDHAVKVCIWICWIVSTVLANEQLRAADYHTHVGLDKLSLQMNTAVGIFFVSQL